MKKSDVVKILLGTHWQLAPTKSTGQAFAPTNIALCKYWGKRNTELNLPLTSSLSVSLAEKGAHVTLQMQDTPADVVTVNTTPVAPDSAFYQKLVQFVDLFRAPSAPRLQVTITSNIPIAAGLASSACGFASLILALDDLFGWHLPASALSILARLGSGSASRSVESGFIEWQQGMRADGMDSYGVKLNTAWQPLRVGLLIVSEREKMLSSREAMQRTIHTSALYSAWPDKVEHDLVELKRALMTKDFDLLGKTAESNAMTMHATMLAAWPSIQYATPETVVAMQKIWHLRQQGLPVYFTQDAGPNIKLLFQQEHVADIVAHFPSVDIVTPFPDEPCHSREGAYTST